MAYISSLATNSYTCDLAEDGHVLFDGRSLALDWRQIAPLTTDAQGKQTPGGRYTLLLAGRSYEFYARRLVSPEETTGQTYEIQLANHTFTVHVEDERTRTLLGSIAQVGQTSGDVAIRTPMPGLVLSLPKPVGAPLERGDTVAVLEAMKMENDLTTPCRGTVKEIHVHTGQTVNQGDILVVVAGD